MPDQVASDEQLATLTQNVLQLEEPSKKSTAQQHWLVYPEEKTPEYIIDAKKRLNQIRQPNLVPNTATAVRHVKISSEPAQVIDESRRERAQVDSSDNEKRHWLTWPNPSTPEKVREIRARLGDDRYRRMAELKSKFRRPKTAFYAADVPLRLDDVSHTALKIFFA